MIFYSYKQYTITNIYILFYLFNMIVYNDFTETFL